MVWLRNISRILTGLVFVFSGFVKAVDPWGFAYKLGDYFEAFNIDFLHALAMPISILMILLEFLTGLALLLNVRMKFFSWLLLILMSYFFILTFIIALTNPVTDCGCFGDFLIISNWETFFKNVILMGFTLIIFIHRKNFTEQFKPFTEWAIVAALSAMVVFFMVYNINHLPVTDFRPYHIGANIPSKMEIPEGAPVDEYETTLIYEKDGEQKEFKLSDPEWQDGTWTWVETKQKLINKGYEPPIHDFIITNNMGDDVTWEIAYDQGYKFLLIAHKIKQKNAKAYAKANEIALFCDQSPEFGFYAITSSLQQDVDALKEKVDLVYDFYGADNITLKTMVRANPGLLLIKDGSIVGKWHYNDFPEVETFNDYYFASLMDVQRKQIEKNRVWVLFSVLAFMISLGYIVLKKFPGV